MSKQNRSGTTQLASAAASALLAVLGMLALLLVLLGIFARPGKDGVSRLAGHPILTVLSGSMVPAFHPGDLVVDDPVTTSQANRLAPGDVITFHVRGSATNLITHRIAAVKPAVGRRSSSNQVSYETKGDANNAPDDQLVSPSQIAGTYSKHIPLGGYFAHAVQKKIVFVLLILLPLLYAIGATVAKYWRDPEAPDNFRDADVDAPGSASDADQSPRDSRELALSASGISRLRGSQVPAEGDDAGRGEAAPASR